MRAMILAAGLGTRMRPLTDHTPKPLLEAGGKALLGWHIERLVAAGYRELVVNASHLAEQVVEYCGDGSAWGASIVVSRELEPLETAGGIVQALPLLGSEPFLVINGDVWTDYPFERVMASPPAPGAARLVLVDNPPQHPLGDFRLEAGRVCRREGDAAGFTFSGIAVYSPEFFAGLEPGVVPLRPLFERAIAEGRLSGEHYKGHWHDIGTPERLAALDRLLKRGG
ncbi:nucleotidyltransferase family protein [Parahaliea maris]|uniref:Nucleotidyltransferase family protein n=1 Tax=Parahaliea maris TaxID=2716870 RepID=A0A5C8ZR85_9GAMM|nr:nucleotidyltransferase family protein [Parahaliea maris]TXS90865.1 nucleotidyltransferase family protein [Parahaliea maris]